MGEGQGCPLCKEGKDLVLQYSVRCEESKMLNNLSDHEFLVGVRGTVKDMCYEVRRAEACVD
jgi:hypothetical protein